MASLLLGDLNDYIEPSQACIVPAKQEKEDKGPVSINLTDCLACSGCITSAETILVAQQTFHQLLEAIDSGKYTSIAVSIAPQVVTALAVKFGLDLQVSWRKLNYFLKSILAVHTVIDIAQVRWITLQRLALEFQQRRQDGPLIVSACPGWVCYAEKRYPDFLPWLSRTRSPQQMAGTLVKHVLPNGGLKPEEIFHCSMMPCFDKKLEASREDFMADLHSREVDTVITTTELLQIFEEKQVSFVDLTEDPDCDPLWRHEGSGAGGFLEFVLKDASDRLGVPGDIVTVPGRNSDMTEYQFVDKEGNVLLRFAAIYGFRNIQTFVIKQRKPASAAKYDFVEIMACPGACLNGGGQPKLAPGSSRTDLKEHSSKLEAVYQSAPLPSESKLVSQVLQWVEQDPSRERFLLASYQAVEESDQLKKTINVQW